MNDAPGPGHNRPTLLDRVTELVGTCNRWTQERPVIESAEIAAIAKDYQVQLRQCRDELDAAQKGEIDPHNAAIKSIRERYRDPKALIGIAYIRMGELLTPWMQREQDRLDAEVVARQQAAEEARQRAERAEDQATRTRTVEDELAVQRASEEAERLEAAAGREPQKARVRGDLSNKAASLHTYWHATIDDFRAATRFYWKHDATVPEVVKTAVQRAANKHAREAKDEGAAPEGVTFVRTERAI